MKLKHSCCPLVLAFVLVCAAAACTQRDADLLRASGLSDELFAAPPGGSKYDGSGTLNEAEFVWLAEVEVATKLLFRDADLNHQVRPTRR